jgi:hypothetical protein
MGAALFMAVYHSPWVTQRGVKKEQPVPFSHQLHARDLGLDCRYCHTGVEVSPVAGIPPLKTCLTCHKEVKKDSPLLEPLRAAADTGRPLKWKKLNAVPDYTYFDHSIHVRQGVACVSCHGPVADMAVVAREHTLYMRWCLSCHRHPENFVRPREAVFRPDWKPGDDPKGRTGRDLVAEYGIQSKLDCNACHR